MTGIKMILADDEPVISSGIKKLVDWDTLGIEIVATYEDGKSAFDGIIRLRPDIALLDISMPKMTGIEILKELRALEIETNVIFISGFQDFSYAKDAIKYGAEDYLLKPIITEDLINAIEKCVAYKKEEIQPNDNKGETAGDYSKLIEVENASYTTVYADLVLPADCPKQMEQLIRFSFRCTINDYLEENNLGIIVEKNQDLFMVLKEENRDKVYDLVKAISEKIAVESNQTPFFVIGRAVKNMGDIPGEASNCTYYKNYRYFVNQLDNGILFVDLVRKCDEGQDKIQKVSTKLIDAAISQNEKDYEVSFDKFSNLVCKMSRGKKEDACYYFCALARSLVDRINELQTDLIEKTDYLEIARATVTYSELVNSFHGIFCDFMNSLHSIALKSDKQSFFIAKDYIEAHYNEDISLNIMSDVVHMNPYYFSTFFKKNSGMNFKEYVGKVRIDHSMPLLISTDKKTYEIAMEVGFSDARAFSDAFQKIYKETPNNYRKRIRANKGIK